MRVSSAAALLLLASVPAAMAQLGSTTLLEQWRDSVTGVPLSQPYHWEGLGWTRYRVIELSEGHQYIVRLQPGSSLEHPRFTQPDHHSGCLQTRE